jgi:hypothetical protein
MGNALVNWWASFPEIPVSSAVCPASASGEAQTAPAVIAVADWQSAFSTAAFITIVVATLMVFLAYETRVIGDQFWKRWWRFLVGTAVIAALASFVWLAWLAPVHTDACQFGNVTTRIPLPHAINRSTVALAQAVLLFVLGSWLLTRVARLSKRPTWYNNSQIPFRF